MRKKRTSLSGAKGGLTFGRKMRAGVLPRITAALSEFVTPIASKGTQPVQAGSASQFRRFEPEKQKVPPDPKGEAPPGRQQEKPPEQPAEALAQVIPIRPEADAQKENGLASTLIQLLALFKEHHATLIRMLGMRSYMAAERRQRLLSGKRGAILDRKAE